MAFNEGLVNATNWFDRTLAMPLRAWFGPRGLLPIAGTATSVDEAPLRAQLFTAEEMEQHGRHLAAGHELTRAAHAAIACCAGSATTRRVLAEAARCSRRAPTSSAASRRPANGCSTTSTSSRKRCARPSATCRPATAASCRASPSGANAGLPRVYDLALHAVAHGDSRLGRGTLTRFIASYQTVKTLQLGELWAMPIMLRLALIENLRRVAARVAASLAERDLAVLWADRMIDVAERDPKSLILVVADMARSEPPMTAPFVAELSRRAAWPQHRAGAAADLGRAAPRRKPPDDRAAGAARRRRRRPRRRSR